MPDIKDVKVEAQGESGIEKNYQLESGEIRDIGAQLFAEVDQISPEELEREGTEVRRILDRRVMPIIYLTYCIQFLDKLSLNYASAYTLILDLGLEGQRYSWVAAIYNFGYLAFAIPSNLLLQRLPLAKYMGGSLLIWSGMSFTAMFYKRSEQPLRMAIWLSANGTATMVGALLGFGLGHVHNTSLESWKLIFLVIGLLNFATHHCGPARLQKHGVKTKQFKFRQALELVYDIKVLCILGMGISCGVINGGVSNFASSLIRGYGFSGIYATLLQLPTGALEAVVVPICGLVPTYIRNSRCIVLAVVSLIPFGGLLGIHFTDISHPWTLVGCTWLQYIIGGPVIISWNLLSTNIAGHTKRSIANGLWFTLYAGGNVAGSNIFFANEAPRYHSALTGLLICYTGMIVLSGIAYVVMKIENVGGIER
ncbi:major facilitator superfamily domain-containing protein [Aspergillus desertorum]